MLPSPQGTQRNLRTSTGEEDMCYSVDFRSIAEFVL